MRLFKPAFASVLASVLAVVTATTAFAGAGYPNPGRDSTTTSYVAGAYIIDSGAVSAGATKQTIGQGLKPYGLVYALLKAKVEVDWIINPSKSPIDQVNGNAGTDFAFDCDGAGTAYSQKNYRTGAFVIPKEFSAQAKPIVDAWLANSANAGLTVDGPCTAPLPNLPVFSKITSWPRTTLDAQNGSVAVPYFTNAGIPQGSTTDPANPPAYRTAAPSQLTSCDDLYVMPHADPTYATHKELKTFVLNGGSFYASCHAVSVVENMVDPASPNTKYMNFLTSNGLINYDAHSQGTAPYNFYKPSTETQAFKGSNDGQTLTDLESLRPGDPIAQFLGVTTAATQQGSEQIFIPAPGSYWRPTTQIVQYDSTQANASATNGPATSLVYGPAFGDTTGVNGWVMYQGGHSLNKGSVDDVAAQRAFFNMVLLTAVDRRPANSTQRSRSPIVNVTSPAEGVAITGGSQVPVSGTATGGSGSYTYTWSAMCYDQNGVAVNGGTFANGSNPSTTFTAPAVTGKVNCNMTLTVVDTCGRYSFGVRSVVFAPDANLVLTKTASPSTASVGGLLTYTLTVKNTGKVNGTQDGPTNTATDVKLTDPLPTGVTFDSATIAYDGTAPAGATCSLSGNIVNCDLKNILDEQTATVTVRVYVNADQGGLNLVNRASVSASTADSDPASNTATVVTAVQNAGIALTVSANPTMADSAGSSVTYTYRVSNAGQSAIENVVLKDTNGTQAIPGDDITPTLNPAGDANNDGKLDLNEVWVYTSTRAVDSNSPDENTDNNSLTKRTIATVSGNIAPGGAAVNAIGEATVRVVTPSLSVTKSTSTAKVKDGGVGSFVLNVTNTSNGPVTINNILVSDTYTIGGSLTCKENGQSIQLISATATAPAQKFTYTIPSLTQGATWTARCEISGVSATGTNVLTASAANPLNQAVTITPSQNASVNVEKATPDLAVSKSASVSSARIGDSFKYTISVMNNMGTSQTAVNVTDALPNYLRLDNLTRTRVNTQASVSGITSGVVAWDKFNSSSNSGSGWASSTWATSGGNVSISSSRYGFSFGSTSSTKSISRDVVLGTDTYQSLNLSLACTTTLTGTNVVPAVTLTSGSGGSATTVTAVAASGQSCGVSSGWSTGSFKQILYTIPVTALAGASSPTFTLTVGATMGSSKALYIDDIFINAGQIAFDSQTSNSDGNGWASDWTVSSTPSGKFTLSSGQLYLNRSQSSTYSGTASRLVSISGDTYANAAISFQCAHGQFGTNDFLEIKANGVSILRDDYSNRNSQQCSTSMSSAATITRALSARGTVNLEITTSTSNVKVYLADFAVTGKTAGTVTDTRSGLSLADLAGNYTLAAGERIDFVLDVTVTGSPNTGTELLNTASAVSAQVPGGSSSTSAVTLLKAGFDVQKSVSDSIIASGRSVIYTYVVTNTGNTSVQDIHLVDDNGPAPTINVITPSTQGLQTPAVLTLGAGVTQTVNNVDNGDDVLDPGEVWTFTVSSGTLTSTTVGNVTLDGYEQVLVDDGTGNMVPGDPNQLPTDNSSETVTVISPALTITATPVSANIYAGSSVSYRYLVTNTGTASVNIRSVAVVANNCAAPLYDSGDTNGDQKIQPSETWVFVCATAPIASSQTNQAVYARGLDDVLTSPIAITSNSLNVGVTVYQPGQISVSRSASSVSGGTTTNSTTTNGVATLNVGLTNAVTYTYAVTNLGTDPLENVALIDDQCSPLTGPVGDTNSDGKLQASETWTYTCVAPVDLTERVISTATASATDPTGSRVESDPKRADVSVLTPSVIVKLTPSTEYVKYGESVLFTYTVENNGGTDITALVPADNSCSPLVRVSSSGNTDNTLAVGEIWTYTCTRPNYTADHTSTFTVTGIVDSLSYSGYVAPESNAKVFVIDPSLAVSQTATVYAPATFVSVANPGTPTQGPAASVNAALNDVIVYTYSVTSGAATHGSSIGGLNAILINSITDAHCAPIAPVDLNNDGVNDGDTNGNGQLDPSESWQFNCSTVQVTAAAGVVDAQATVSAITVVDQLTLRPASVRVTVAGAQAPSTPPAGGSVTVTPVTPTPVTPTPVTPTPVTPTPVTPTPVTPITDGPAKLTDKVYFNGDSAVLLPPALKQISALADKIKKHKSIPDILVVGKVKETSDKSYDLKLSKARALAVAKELKRLGVKANFTLVAHGISPENKAVSRRVEIVITWSSKG